MCGIIGYIGPRPVVPVLVDGLRRLEYRGYDSAGIAVVNDGHDGHPPQCRQARRTSSRCWPRTRSAGAYGLGHTRWATHGRPTEENAHPHRDCTGRLVVVHNGIIENYLELKRSSSSRATGSSPRPTPRSSRTWSSARCAATAWRRPCGVRCAQLRGLFAIVLLSADDPDTIVAARNGPPMVVGLGEGEYLRRVRHPGHPRAHPRRGVPRGRRDGGGDAPSGVTFTDWTGGRTTATPQRVLWDPVMAERAGLQALHAEGDLRAAASRRARRWSGRVSPGPHAAYARRAEPRTLTRCARSIA